MINEVKNSLDDNQLIKKLKEDPENKRISSIKSILKSKKLKIKPKSFYNSLYPKFFKNISFNLKLFNVLNRNHFPIFELDD